MKWYRLNTITKALNVALSSIVETLNGNGYSVEAKPTAEISEEQLESLAESFSLRYLKDSLRSSTKSKSILIIDEPELHLFEDFADLYLDDFAYRDIHSDFTRRDLIIKKLKKSFYSASNKREWIKANLLRRVKNLKRRRRFNTKVADLRKHIVSIIPLALFYTFPDEEDNEMSYYPYASHLLI